MISAILLPVASIIIVLGFRLVELGMKWNILPGPVKERLGLNLLRRAGVWKRAGGPKFPARRRTAVTWSWAWLLPKWFQPS